MGQGERLRSRHAQPLELALTAARKATESSAPRELPPGRYTVILEPAAVLDLNRPDVSRFQRHWPSATAAVF